MVSHARILLFHEGDASVVESLRTHLTNEGFHVDSASTFLEAAPFLGPGRADLFLFYLPEKEWVRNAILTEARRANTRLPIVVMAPHLSEELFQLLARFHVFSVLPSRGNWRSTVESIRKALATAEPEAASTVDTRSHGGER